MSFHYTAFSFTKAILEGVFNFNKLFLIAATIRGQCLFKGVLYLEEILKYWSTEQYFSTEVLPLKNMRTKNICQ